MKLLKLLRMKIIGVSLAGVMGMSAMLSPVCAIAADDAVSANEAEEGDEDAVADPTEGDEAEPTEGASDEEEENADAPGENESVSGNDIFDPIIEDGLVKPITDPEDIAFCEWPIVPEQPSDPGEGEEEEEEDPDEPAAYTGISIDGKFSDWKAVPKYDGTGMIQKAAVIQDGDYVYVYLKDDGNCCAAWSGPKNNGKFSFVSNLGYTTTFQLNNNPASVSGVDGAFCSYVFSWDKPDVGQWEIAIPVSALPVNTGSYSFGYYQGDRFVDGIIDERYSDNGGGNEDDAPFDGIVYDGLYGDWKNYPHTLIHYATSGTEERVVDGEGALYTDGSTLYGHCITIMNRHLNNEGGNEMLEGVVLRINGNDNMLFEYRFATVDGAGNINWHPQLEYLSEGTYEYIITDVNGWGNAATLEELEAQGVDKDGYYGRIFVTVDAVTDECEWWLNLPLLAERFGLDETDIKTIEVKYEQIGDRWLETAGASSGAMAGVMLSLSAVGAVYVLRRKKDDRGQCTL